MLRYFDSKKKGKSRFYEVWGGESKNIKRERNKKKEVVLITRGGVRVHI
jgi:hypothetical protein